MLKSPSRTACPAAWCRQRREAETRPSRRNGRQRREAVRQRHAQSQQKATPSTQQPRLHRLNTRDGEARTREGAKIEARGAKCSPRSASCTSSRHARATRTNTLPHDRRCLGRPEKVGPSTRVSFGCAPWAPHRSRHPLSHGITSLWQLPQTSMPALVTDSSCRRRQGGRSSWTSWWSVETLLA